MSAEKIRELRKNRRIGQIDLANRIGVTQSFISQIENGCRKGLPDTMEAIAKELGCLVEDITGEPSFYIQFIRNCKRLSQAQLLSLNEVVLQFAKLSKPAENQSDSAGINQQIKEWHNANSRCNSM
jgi:DNA-binding XRE family transcriptional regulator